MSAASGSRAKLVACPQTTVESLKAELASQREIPPELDVLPRPEGTSLQTVLRQALRTRLDRRILPVVTDEDGRQTVLDNDDMKALYKRRRNHMQAYRDMLHWALVRSKKSSVATAACPLDTPRVAYAFWHSMGDAPKRLPRSFAEGLASCFQNSGLRVVLLTYHCQLGDVPTGVVLYNASTLLTWPDCVLLLQHNRVQHISD
jgi:hypothetical protein